MQTLIFNGHPIRVVDIPGAPWFVARDICGALGLGARGGSVAHHFVALAPDELSFAPALGVALSGTGMSNARLVSVSGVRKITMRAGSMLGQSLREWIASEIPTPGVAAPESPAAPRPDELTARVVARLADRVARLKVDCAVARASADEMEAALEEMNEELEIIRRLVRVQ